MNGLIAYILAKKIAVGAVSGIERVAFEDGSLVFYLNNGSTISTPVPLPKDGVSVKDLKIDDAGHLQYRLTNNDQNYNDAGLIPSNVIFTSELPEEGKEDRVYVKEYSMYVWNGSSYIKINSNFDNEDEEEDTKENMQWKDF